MTIMWIPSVFGYIILVMTDKTNCNAICDDVSVSGRDIHNKTNVFREVVPNTFMVEKQRERAIIAVVDLAYSTLE